MLVNILTIRYNFYINLLLTFKIEKIKTIIAFLIFFKQSNF